MLVSGFVLLLFLLFLWIVPYKCDHRQSTWHIRVCFCHLLRMKNETIAYDKVNSLCCTFHHRIHRDKELPFWSSWSLYPTHTKSQRKNVTLKSYSFGMTHRFQRLFLSHSLFFLFPSAIHLFNVINWPFQSLVSFVSQLFVFFSI